MTENKRRFQRIPFDAQVTLEITHATEKPISGALHDISLKGALIAVGERLDSLTEGDEGELVITPEQGDIELKLNVIVAYLLPDQHLAGLNLVSMDVESAGHLRRLVEVNLGDENSLQRELSNLIDAMEKEHQT